MPEALMSRDIYTVFTIGVVHIGMDVILSKAKDLLFSWACKPLQKKQILRSDIKRRPSE